MMMSYRLPPLHTEAVGWALGKNSMTCFVTHEPQVTHTAELKPGSAA